MRNNERIKLLIGYDGSQFATAALDDLRRAGLPREAQAIILTVFERWLPPATGSQGPQNALLKSSVPGSPAIQTSAVAGAAPVTETLALALAAKSRLQEHFPGWEIGAEESSGSPAREILKKAEDWRPDLIAIGSQGHSGLGRFLLGSVSQKVANEAPCSVRVARGTAWKDGAPVRIVLALDGSACSEAAVRAVAARMWPVGSEVRLITVIDPSNAAAGTSNQRDGGKWVQEFLAEAAKTLRGLELVVSSKIEQGDPKHLIIVNAEEWGADCIFVGASCVQKPFQRFLLGSVATAVVSRAHCSVEVVRGGADRLV
jgi:nucleotide-binding universal stress UspA family protein